MTLRSLLVLLDQNPLCAARTQIALRLAKANDCHLVGVAPTGLVSVSAMLEGAPWFIDMTAVASDKLRDQAERSVDHFRDACRAAGAGSFEAVIDEADTAASLLRHAHCSDLTILTQADPGAPDHRRMQDLIEQVVLASARPTLIVPYAASSSPATIGANVLVAWDDSRQSVRALSDALPLLRRADRIVVVSWDESRSSGNNALHSRLDALAQWLTWHGITAEMRVERAGAHVGDAMLSLAAELGSDLIVMGAYGHARWSERLMGGATRALLAAMTVPVLMSH